MKLSCFWELLRRHDFSRKCKVIIRFLCWA